MTHEEVFTTLAAELRSYRAAAADLVPDPDQVPRRAAPEVGPAARARVHDEGLVLVRPRRGGSRRVVPAPLRRVPPDLRALRPRAARGRGVVGRDGRQRVGRVHGGERRGRGLGRVVRRLRLRGEPGEGDVAARRRSRIRAGARPRPSVRDAGRAHDRRPRELRGRRRRPRARSRRSSTCSTARPRWCCCAAITRSSSRSCRRRRAPREVRAGERRGDPRGARRVGRAASAPSASRACAIVADVALRGRRDMMTGANQDELPPARRRRRARHRRRRAGSICARCAPARPCPMCGGAAARRQDHRGRPHLQARHALHARSSARVVLDEAGAARADRDGLVRHRHRARDGRRRRALSRRERHRLAASRSRPSRW